MKSVVQYDQKSAMKQFKTMLVQWQNNAGELAKHSRSNPKVREMCQSLSEAVEAVVEWAELSGSIMLVAAYQPSMFDDEEFGRGADFDPR